MKQVVYAIKNVDGETEGRFAYLDVTGNTFRYASLLEVDNDIEQPPFFITTEFDSAKWVLMQLLNNSLWKDCVIEGTIFIEKIETSMTVLDTYCLSENDLLNSGY